jgi:hypothetical protein
MLALRSIKDASVPLLLAPGIPRMRLYELLRAIVLRQRDVPWEVVDHKVVQPVPTFYDDEGMHSHASHRRINKLND